MASGGLKWQRNASIPTSLAADIPKGDVAGQAQLGVPRAESHRKARKW